MKRLATFLIPLALALAISPAPSNAAEPGAKRGTEARLIKVEQVEVRASLVGPVVLLKVQGKAIPVFVDSVVAQSIQGALTGEKFPRPLTHDLMRTVLEAYEGKVTQAVITLKDRTFYADELNELTWESLHFGLYRKPIDGERRFILAGLDPGRDFRAWRIEYLYRTCQGLGFDS